MTLNQVYNDGSTTKNRTTNQLAGALAIRFRSRNNTRKTLRTNGSLLYDFVGPFD